MTPSTVSYNSVFLTIIFATLAISLPVVTVLLIRFLWDRKVNLGRSKDLDKLIWQLHRVASAMEHQMNLSFPPVQPGTEEPHDLAYLKPIPVESESAPRRTAVEPGTQPDQKNLEATPGAATEQAPAARAPIRHITSDTPQRGGVNSMFGL